MKKQQGNLPMAIMMIVIFVAVVGVAGYFVYQKSLGTVKNEPVACTMEAKICPDGTSVGRVAPDCEFAPCPEDVKANWQTYKNEQYSVEIKYPQNFWAAQNLQVAQKDCNYDFLSDECPNAKNIIKSELEADGLDLANVSISGAKKTYGSNLFCLYGYSDGAAGTYYSNEYYVMSSNKKCTIIKIVTPYPNCQNYLPLESGNTEQEKNYNNCLTSNQEKPKILEQVLSTLSITATNNITDEEQSCVSSGGKVLTIDCYCSGTSDFFNNCAIGACTCTPNPEYLRKIKTCQCPTGQCFNGQTCAASQF